MKSDIFLNMESMFFEYSWEAARVDGERIGANRKLWETGFRPRSSTEVLVGDEVMPFEPYWYRGPGIVDCVDSQGRIWVTYSGRPSDSRSSSVRCYQYANETVVIGRSKK